MNMIWFDVLIVVCFIGYGIKFLRNTPAYLDKQGFNTKYTKLSEAAWKYGHKVAGIYCIIGGVVIGIRAAIEKFCFDGNAPGVFSWVAYGLEIVIIVLLIPVTNAFVKKKFGK